MPIDKDTIATTGITTPVIILSFAVKLEEVGSGLGDVVEVSEVAFVASKVAFAICTSDVACTGNPVTVTCPIISCANSPFSQYENPTNEVNRATTLDPKAVALALAGLVIEGDGILVAEP